MYELIDPNEYAHVPVNVNYTKELSNHTHQLHKITSVKPATISGRFIYSYKFMEMSSGTKIIT